jgi:hypothetical protein
MMNLEKAVIYLKKSHVKSLPMAAKFFGKTAGIIPLRVEKRAAAPANLWFDVFAHFITQTRVRSADFRLSSASSIDCGPKVRNQRFPRSLWHL